MTIPTLNLALLLAFTMPTHADPPPTDQPARVNEIEAKYHMGFDAILRIDGVDYWVFMWADHEAMFGQFPVVVLNGANDHDVDTAILAARNVAAFYDAQFMLAPKRVPTPSASPSPSVKPTPAGSAFTMPTHPPRETR